MNNSNLNKVTAKRIKKKSRNANETSTTTYKESTDKETTSINQENICDTSSTTSSLNEEDLNKQTNFLQEKEIEKKRGISKVRFSINTLSKQKALRNGYEQFDCDDDQTGKNANQSNEKFELISQKLPLCFRNRSAR
jgi:hypothetical protein